MDKNEYHRAYNIKRYYRVREAALAQLGGKCVHCGSDENLELDHIEPSKKTMEISKMWAVSKQRFQEELSLCQILCRNCHIAKTRIDLGQNDARQVHGTVSSYRYCKCDLCREAKNSYMRDYKKKRRLSKSVTALAL